MSTYMDYGTEPTRRQSEIRRLLRSMAVAVGFSAALYAAGSYALDVTGGEEISQTIPSISEIVYVEGACLNYQTS